MHVAIGVEAAGGGSGGGQVVKGAAAYMVAWTADVSVGVRVSVSVSVSVGMGMGMGVGTFAVVERCIRRRACALSVSAGAAATCRGSRSGSSHGFGGHTVWSP